MPKYRLTLENLETGKKLVEEFTQTEAEFYFATLKIGTDALNTLTDLQRKGGSPRPASNRPITGSDSPGSLE